MSRVRFHEKLASPPPETKEPIGWRCYGQSNYGLRKLPRKMSRRAPVKPTLRHRCLSWQTSSTSSPTYCFFYRTQVCSEIPAPRISSASGDTTSACFSTAKHCFSWDTGRHALKSAPSLSASTSYRLEIWTISNRRLLYFADYKTCICHRAAGAYRRRQRTRFAWNGKPFQFPFIEASYAAVQTIFLPGLREVLYF